jgi:hypothetical protein
MSLKSSPPRRTTPVAAPLPASTPDLPTTVTVAPGSSATSSVSSSLLGPRLNERTNAPPSSDGDSSTLVLPTLYDNTTVRPSR